MSSIAFTTLKANAQILICNMQCIGKRTAGPVADSRPASLKYCSIGNAIARERLYSWKIGIELEGPCMLLTGLLTTVKSLRRSVTSKTKQTAIYLAFIKDMITRKELRIAHIPRSLNTADLHTKQDVKAVFQKLWSNASPLIWRSYM